MLFKNIFSVFVAGWVLDVSAKQLSSQEDNKFTSIMDILSSSAQFSQLIRHLQVLDLVSLINESKNITLLAPTNAAFQRLFPNSGDKDDGLDRDRFLYHIINETVLLHELEQDRIVQTFLDPSPKDQDEERPDGWNAKVYVSAEGGEFGRIPAVERDLKARNGVVQVLDQLLSVPGSVCEILLQRSNSSSSSILSATSLEETSFTARSFWIIYQREFGCTLPAYATILAPTDQAFHNELRSEVEFKYLLDTEEAQYDRQKFLARHIIDGYYAGADIGANNTAIVSTLDGSNWEISGLNMDINGTYHNVYRDEIAKDGVLQYYAQFVGPVGSVVEFTAEKYLIALNSREFLRELEFRGLLELVRKPQMEKQTLFVPVDSEEGVASKGSVLYHFVNGEYGDPEGLKKSVLLESKANGQRIRISENRNGEILLNEKTRVIGGPYVIGNTTIYSLDGSLELPPSLDLAVGSIYHSSKSAGYMSKFGLLDLARGRKWTVLLPTSDAWKALGLVKNYLSRNENVLERVMKSLIIETPIYTVDAGLVVETNLLDGTNVTVEMEKSGEALILNATGRFQIETANVLSSAGVVHSVDNIEIPKDIEITATDILKSSDSSIFLGLLQEFNLSHVLEPTAKYTILAPSDKFLRSRNITAHTPLIQQLLRLHLIPDNPVHDLFSQHPVASLEPGIHLQVRKVSEDLQFITIFEGEDASREARILARADLASGSSVFELDRVISPDWLPSRHRRPGFALKTPVAILLGVLCGAVLIAGVLACVLVAFLGGASGKKSPEEESLERDPLLGGEQDPENYGSGTDNRTRASSIRSVGSEHSTSEPIPANGASGRRLGLPRV